MQTIGRILLLLIWIFLFIAEASFFKSALSNLTNIIQIGRMIVSGSFLLAMLCQIVFMILTLFVKNN